MPPPMMTARAWLGGTLSLLAVFTARRSGAAVGILLLRRRPGVLGLAIEDRVRLGPLECPGAPGDLRLELTWCPARVADEDPQTVHGLLPSQQLQQQVPVCAQVDATESLDGVLGRLAGSKQEPHRPDFNRSAEVHLVVHLREALEIRKEM